MTTRNTVGTAGWERETASLERGTADTTAGASVLGILLMIALWLGNVMLVAAALAG